MIGIRGLLGIAHPEIDDPRAENITRRLDRISDKGIGISEDSSEKFYNRESDIGNNSENRHIFSIFWSVIVWRSHTSEDIRKQCLYKKESENTIPI